MKRKGRKTVFFLFQDKSLAKHENKNMPYMLTLASCNVTVHANLTLTMYSSKKKQRYRKNT